MKQPNVYVYCAGDTTERVFGLDSIESSENALKLLLKKEKLRWHPDKFIQVAVVSGCFEFHLCWDLDPDCPGIWRSSGCR